MTVEVEIDAYILPDDHKIYKFFPGKSYKFYDLIAETSTAIIDVRGLERLTGSPSDWDEEAVLDAISEDRVERSVAKGDPRPSRVIHSVGDKATQTFLEGLFFKAEKGDLILMPAKGYTSLVRVGELVSDAGELVTLNAEADDGKIYNYFGRKVRWIGSVEKRFFSTDLINLLHSQAAFFDIGRSHYDEIYRRVFDNFVYDKQFIATFRTSKNIFTPKDSFLTSVWLELLEVLEGAREANATLAAGTIYDLVIESNIDEDNRDDLSISVQSPGWFRIRSLVAAPLASLALFALASQGVAFDQAIAATTSAKIVRVTVSDCMGDVDASVRDYIKLLGKDRWEQTCKLAAQADAEAKLKADARVKSQPQAAPKTKGN